MHIIPTFAFVNDWGAPANTGAEITPNEPDPGNTGGGSLTAPIASGTVAFGNAYLPMVDLGFKF